MKSACRGRTLQKRKKGVAKSRRTKRISLSTGAVLILSALSVLISSSCASLKSISGTKKPKPFITSVKFPGIPMIENQGPKEPPKYAKERAQLKKMAKEVKKLGEKLAEQVKKEGGNEMELLVRLFNLCNKTEFLDKYCRNCALVEYEYWIKMYAFYHMAKSFFDMKLYSYQHKHEEYGVRGAFFMVKISEEKKGYETITLLINALRRINGRRVSSIQTFPDESGVYFAIHFPDIGGSILFRYIKELKNELNIEHFLTLQSIPLIMLPDFKVVGAPKR